MIYFKRKTERKVYKNRLLNLEHLKLKEKIKKNENTLYL